MNWIRNRLRRWLGIENHERRINELDGWWKDVCSIGVDVHFKEPHMILIYTRLAGGQLRHIEASFDSISELNDFVKELKSRFRTKRVTWDAPRDMKQFLGI